MYEASVIADSINGFGQRITTVECTYPRIIHAEIMTHRDRARNAASSRAIPWPKMCERVRDNPFVPLVWGREQSGMQTGGPIPDHLAKLADKLWLQLCGIAMQYAVAIHNIDDTYQTLSNERYHTLKDLLSLRIDESQPADGTKIHKSLPNRLIEPWMWITVVMTATQWENYFALRCHKDAEIHFQKIAKLTRDAMDASTPRLLEFGQWHVPYVSDEEQEQIKASANGYLDSINKLVEVSTARCARLSYLTHDGKRDFVKDVGLYKRLRYHDGLPHASPMEHAAMSATPDVRSGPFIGWLQHRKQIPNECGDATWQKSKTSHNLKLEMSDK